MAALAPEPLPSPRPLTWRQAKVLRFIRDHTAAHGYPPSLRETGDACGLASVSSVQHVLAVLAAKGYVTRAPGKPRTVVVLDAPEGGLR